MPILIADCDENGVATDLAILDVFAILAGVLDSELQRFATPWTEVVGVNQAMHARKSHLADVTRSIENR
jgi:hypothetical protein